MEPLNATVWVRGAAAEVWVSTRARPTPSAPLRRRWASHRRRCACIRRTWVVALGGGWSRTLPSRPRRSRGPWAKPVKTIWSRENDMRAGHYRPAVASRVRLALDHAFMPTGIRHDTAGPSLLRHSGVTGVPPHKGFDWSYIMGWVDMAYAIPAKDARWTEVEAGIPCGYWRSVGNSQNCFFLEHTLDQTARLAGIEPSLTGGACWRAPACAGLPGRVHASRRLVQPAGARPLPRFRDEQQWQDHVPVPTSWRSRSCGPGSSGWCASMPPSTVASSATPALSRPS